ncbi:hypothetical protein GQ602_003326 [Ophiocordyceps camponoti-floridani]|uniref:Uncharacterized protein n=1 Tax=Ophiocordyceps camponoti-floridani TaxID=2030778 RepID=A0A8H4Q803_9HYPO|nr:hypothetical protein GQ602_003326 [Ophiocordyceps camponoti-floridani]
MRLRAAQEIDSRPAETNGVGGREKNEEQRLLFGLFHSKSSSRKSSSRDTPFTIHQLGFFFHPSSCMPSCLAAYLSLLHRREPHVVDIQYLLRRRP